MPSFLDSEPSSMTSSSQHHSKQQRNVQPPPVAASMPQILNDDLQLSESDDDSD